MRAGAYVRYSSHTDELLEVPRDKLRAIVANDSWLLVRVLFQCSLYDRLDVTLGH